MTGSVRVELSARRQSFEARNLPHLDRIHSNALLLLKDPRQAANLVVETYAAAYQSWDAGRAEYLLLRDLCRIMVDLFYRVFSAEKQVLKSESSDAVKSNAPMQGFSPAGPVEDTSGITPENARNAVGNLPEDIRPVAVMYYSARFSCLEVAEIVGRQRELTKSMIRRSRELLQDSLLGGAGGGACVGISAK